MDRLSRPPSEEALPVHFVVGIDVGSQSCSISVLAPDKGMVIKPTTMAHAATGFALLEAKLAGLGAPPEQVLVGLEATSRYGENLCQFLTQRGYQVCLLHPAHTHPFARALGACAPKLTNWMPRPLPMSCSAPKRATAMCPAT